MVTVLGEVPNKGRTLREVMRILKDDGLLAIGELLFDPDYPRKDNVIGWCRDVGFDFVGSYGNVLHYLLTFRKIITRADR